MRIKLVLSTAFVFLVATAGVARAQSSTVLGGLAASVGDGLAVNLIGYGMTAIGLNSQASFQTSVLNQLSQINDELNTITNELAQIQTEIQTDTCIEQLSASSVTDALASIATVSNTYVDLLQAGESTTGTVSPADINNFLNQVANGPGGGEPSISSALSTINIALQSTNNDGIIGTCEKAVTSLPATGSFGADATFYSDPINLMQYFTDYQTVAALLLVEYYHYQAFLNSSYYSPTKIANGLSATEAGEVCAGATGETATQCGFARDVVEEVYVYLQNQYTASGVPYSTRDGNGNQQTGLFLGDNNVRYLFAASLEEFTNFEDIPQNNCPSIMTSGGNPCGLTYRNDPTTSPFWTTLYSPVYQYETSWAPATAEMWRTVLNSWSTGSSSQTVADALTALGFQNTANKIILTSTTYSLNPKVPNQVGAFYPFPQPPDADTAVCYLDTNFDHSFSLQPFCFNGSNDDVSYGDAGTTLWVWGTWDGGMCLTFRTNDTVLDTTNDPGFYGQDYTYDSYLNSDSGYPRTCPAGSWENGQSVGWFLNNGQSGDNFFWPAIDVSNPTCGTNLSYGLLQPALTRSASNFLGVPSMCAADFDNYISDIAPRNPYEQVVVTSPSLSGPGGTSASLGPITIQIQNTYGGSTVPLTFTDDTTVALSSTSLTGFFSLTQNGATVSTVTIPAGQSSASFYYGDTTAGTPQITADPGNMVPGIQTETITSGSTPSTAMVATAVNAGSGRSNGTVQIRSLFPLPSAIQLQNATLTIGHLLNEDTGAGELVHRANGTGVTLPVVLSALPNSTATDAVYATQAGVTPRIRVEIINTAAQGQAQVQIDLAQVQSPITCSGSPQRTRLHTQMTADDGTNPPSTFDEDLDWQCHANGAYLTAVTRTIAGGGTVAVKAVAASGLAGQTVSAGSFVLTNTGSAPISVSSVTVDVSNPALFSTLTLTPPGGGSPVSQNAAATTVFSLNGAVTVAAGQSETFTLGATIAASDAMGIADRTYAQKESGLKGVRRWAMVLGLVGFGAILIPAAGGRNRMLLVLVGLLAVAASMPACGGSNGGASPGSTQTLAANSLNTAGVPISGLPVTLSFVSKQ